MDGSGSGDDRPGAIGAADPAADVAGGRAGHVQVVAAEVDLPGVPAVPLLRRGMVLGGDRLRPAVGPDGVEDGVGVAERLGLVLAVTKAAGGFLGPQAQERKAVQGRHGISPAPERLPPLAPP